MVLPEKGVSMLDGKWTYQMMTSNLKGTADAVAEYYSAVNCVKATNAF